MKAQIMVAHQSLIFEATYREIAGDTACVYDSDDITTR
jgi:hypothetical protein